jgi:hypothetical protein
MHGCGMCGQPATRVCTDCGQFCCRNHSTRFHAIRYAGAVCSDCASSSWMVAAVGFAVFGVMALVVYFSLIKPKMEEHDRGRRQFEQERKRIEREHEEFRKKHGVGFDQPIDR